MNTVSIEVRKFNSQTGAYDKHRSEDVSETTAARIIEIQKKKPRVEGYYLYSFQLFDQVFYIHTLNADLVHFITKTEHPQNSNGNHPTSTGNKA